MLPRINETMVGGTPRVFSRQMFAAASDATAIAEEKCSAPPGDESTATDTPTGGSDGTAPVTPTATVTVTAATDLLDDRNSPRNRSAGARYSRPTSRPTTHRIRSNCALEPTGAASVTPTQSDAVAFENEITPMHGRHDRRGEGPWA